jgi:hypothetical protein
MAALAEIAAYAAANPELVKTGFNFLRDNPDIARSLLGGGNKFPVAPSGQPVQGGPYTFYPPPPPYYGSPISQQQQQLPYNYYASQPNPVYQQKTN